MILPSRANTKFAESNVALLVTTNQSSGVEITYYVGPYLAYLAGKDWQYNNNDDPNWKVIESNNITIKGTTFSGVRK